MLGLNGLTDEVNAKATHGKGIGNYWSTLNSPNPKLSTIMYKSMRQILKHIG
jgi:hypothetical protein